MTEVSRLDLALLLDPSSGSARDNCAVLEAAEEEKAKSRTQAARTDHHLVVC